MSSYRNGHRISWMGFHLTDGFKYIFAALLGHIQWCAESWCAESWCVAVLRAGVLRAGVLLC